MEPALLAWKEYLRFDPTRFLLSSGASPSIWLWYMLDIANRPESSPAATETRERILLSDTVQVLLAAQKEEGYWREPASLAEPRFQATLWNLALLAELGLSRSSRRARAALEYLIGMQDDYPTRWAVEMDPLTLAFLVRSAAYFRLAADPRVLALLGGMARAVTDDSSPDDSLAFLWASGRWPGAFTESTAKVARRAGERVLDELAARRESEPLTFPPFGTRDDLFVLRALAEHQLVRDARASAAVARLVARQDEQARWPLERDLRDKLGVRVEDASPASRWVTLNAVRVIKALILAPSREAVSPPGQK